MDHQPILGESAIRYWGSDLTNVEVRRVEAKKVCSWCKGYGKVLVAGVLSVTCPCCGGSVEPDGG
jgi:Zn finger protein HypA/HybF involved in hydrogenase expression